MIFIDVDKHENIFINIIIYFILFDDSKMVLVYEIFLIFTWCLFIFCLPNVGWDCWNKPVSQMRALLVTCCKLAVDYNTLPMLLYVFEHKT